MTQAQASMQKCLVVFACSVEILHQPPKARAIEVQERGFDVVPGWRGILATNHGHESFKEGFMRRHLGWFKIHAFSKGAHWPDEEVSPMAHALVSVTEEYDHAGSNEFHPDAA